MGKVVTKVMGQVFTLLLNKSRHDIQPILFFVHIYITSMHLKTTKTIFYYYYYYNYIGGGGFQFFAVVINIYNNF